MKRLILASTAALIALSAAASATTSTKILEGQLAQVAPSVDVSTLTPAQINAIEQALASGDSAAEVRDYIEALTKG
jgi:hypothetical protein